MTKPRRHDDPAPQPMIDVGDRCLTLREYALMLQAYLDDNPDWVPRRTGIRSTARTPGALSGLPDGWAEPYLPLLD